VRVAFVTLVVGFTITF